MAALVASDFVVDGNQRDSTRIEVDPYRAITERTLPEQPENRSVGDAAYDFAFDHEHGRHLIDLESADRQARQRPLGEIHTSRRTHAIADSEVDRQFAIEREVPGARVEGKRPRGIRAVR